MNLEDLTDDELRSVVFRVNAILSGRERSRNREFGAALRELDPAEKALRMRALADARQREMEARTRPLPAGTMVYLTPASGIEAGTATTEGRGAEPESPTTVGGDAKGV